MSNKKTAVLSAALVIVGGLFAVSSATGQATVHRAPPLVDPADFDDPQANPYFPLEPGSVFGYRGADGRERFRQRVTITHRTKKIQGVTTTVVRDVIRRQDGSLAEKTRDWYAADNAGNAWYFGEATATYDESGDLESREGSWQAGVDGAVAGMIMPADPRPTDAYRQEFYRGHAEDQAWTVQRHGVTTVPYRRFRDVVRSFEWTRLEPDVMSLKLYAPGVGIVREKDLVGGKEYFELVSVSRP